jgi:hypothetical protein
VGGNVEPGGLACSGGCLSKNIVKFPSQSRERELGGGVWMVRPCHLILHPMSRDQYRLLDCGRYQKQ